MAKTHHSRQEAGAKLPATDREYERSVHDGLAALDVIVEKLDKANKAGRDGELDPALHCAKFARIAMRELDSAIGLLASGQKTEGRLALHSAALAGFHMREEKKLFTRESYETALSNIESGCRLTEGHALLGSFNDAKWELQCTAKLAVELAASLKG